MSDKSLLDMLEEFIRRKKDLDDGKAQPLPNSVSIPLVSVEAQIPSNEMLRELEEATEELEEELSLPKEPKGAWVTINDDKVIRDKFEVVKEEFRKQFGYKASTPELLTLMIEDYYERVTSTGKRLRQIHEIRRTRAKERQKKDDSASQTVLK